MIASAVCLIACHAGPADHFATFAEQLSKNGWTVEAYASGPALKKFQERDLTVKMPFSIENLSEKEEDALADLIAMTCSTASIVITDVGHAFDIKIQKALASKASHIPRFAYYDNPEPYVPGGYSAVAAKVMLAANKVLFANSNLANAPIFQEPGKAIAFDMQQKIGIGYYPVSHAEKIAKRREVDKLAMRQALLAKNGCIDTGQKVLVYFGGNNEEYFLKALPAFLALLKQAITKSDLSNLVIVLQQHPGAKSKNLDAKSLSAWMDQQSTTQKAPRFIVSDFSSDEAQVLADGALYYQTSMGPQFVLAKIPTMQIGHETYNDILVQNKLISSITDVDQLLCSLNSLTDNKQEIPQNVILEGLGIYPNYLEILEKTMKDCHPCK